MDAKPWRRSDISDVDVAKAAASRKDGEFITHALSRQFTGCPEKVLYAAIERAESHGLIESGVSLRSGWLTEEGRKLLSIAPPTPAEIAEK